MINCHDLRLWKPGAHTIRVSLLVAIFTALLALTGIACRREPPSRPVPSRASDVTNPALADTFRPANVDVDALKALLPTEMGMMRRHILMGETNTVAPFAIAKGIYEISSGARIEITIADVGLAPDGLASIRGLDWLTVQRERESDTEYEKIWVHAGSKVYEKFNNASRMGLIRSLFANRFLIEIASTDATPEVLTNVFRNLHLYELRRFTGATRAPGAARHADPSFPVTRSSP